mgnify:CR=1 FL=1
MVLVSHDRHLLETTVDEFQLVAEGGVRPFDGDLDDYARWLQQSRREAKAPAGDNKTAGKDDAKQRRQDAARLRERPAYKEAKEIDARLIEERQNG